MIENVINSTMTDFRIKTNVSNLEVNEDVVFDLREMTIANR